MLAFRRPESSSRSVRRVARGVVCLLTLPLVTLPLLTPFGLGCASSKGGARDADGAPAAEARTLFTVDDVVRLELRRAPPREFEGALSPPAPAEVRARATLALARLEHTGALPLLYRAAKDDSALVRRHAAFGLGQLDAGLVPDRDLHDEMRIGVESFLVAWHGSEVSPAVRAAIVRALGRVSLGQGIDHLLHVAREGAEREEALYALGVSGARRAAALSSDARLLDVVVRALVDQDVKVRRAAAYAAFRQKLRLPDDVLVRALDQRDAAARIHLARAMAETLQQPQRALPLLDDGDWRVRVEATRALLAQALRGGALPVPALRAAGVAAAKELVQAGGSGAEAHVVMAVCDALGDPGLPLPPDDILPALASIMSVLAPATEKVDAVRCRCAVALDALGSAPNAVRSCAPSWAADRVRRLEVQVAAHGRFSSRERVAWLEGALADPSVPVRVQAAWALVDDGSRHAARLAAARLEREDDPAVAGALLLLFDGANAEELSDVTLARVVDRFYGAQTLEAAEPLLQAARLLTGRLGASARATQERLRAHPEPRLREIVDAVPHGERAAGPRADAGVPPAPADLPLAAILRTERGDIQLTFDRETAPVAVNNFVTLARAGFYDGVVFHRVVSDFVAQGGDPRGDGSGGPGHHIPCENSDGRYERGAVGMALAGKDTGGSQFFLTHSEQPHLDGRYTLFAHVTSGLEVMDALMPDDRILSVQLAGAVPAREVAP